MKNLMFICILAIFLMGCTSENIQDAEESIDSILINLIDTHESGNDNFYTLELVNNTNYRIEVIDLMMGYGVYPDVQSQGYSSEIMFNAKAFDGKYGLDNNETAMFQVHIPVSFLKEDMVDFDDIQISITGYLGSMKDENRFQKSGSIYYFSNEE